MFRWDGSTLQTVHTGGGPGFSPEVIVRAPDDVTVGGNGALVRFDGHVWKPEQVPIPRARFAGGPAGLFAFGPSGGIARRSDQKP